MLSNPLPARAHRTHAPALPRAQNDLQRQLKLNLLKIEERELIYFTENCYNIGTQAALLAGFSFSALMQASAIAGTMNKGIQVLRVRCG